MKKVIVTGQAGFSGSHLSQELAKRDYHMVITDALYTGNISEARFRLQSEVYPEEGLKDTIRYMTP